MELDLYLKLCSEPINCVVLSESTKLSVAGILIWQHKIVMITG